MNERRTMEVLLSPAAVEKYLHWLNTAYVYVEETMTLVEVLRVYFPDKRTFDSAVPMLKALGIGAMKKEDQDLLQATDIIKSRRNKKPEEKELMNQRNRILSRLNQSLARLRDELFPPPADLSDLFPQRTESHDVVISLLLFKLS